MFASLVVVIADHSFLVDLLKKRSIPTDALLFYHYQLCLIIEYENRIFLHPGQSSSSLSCATVKERSKTTLGELKYVQ